MLDVAAWHAENRKPDANYPTLHYKRLQAWNSYHMIRLVIGNRPECQNALFGYSDTDVFHEDVPGLISPVFSMTMT